MKSLSSAALAAALAWPAAAFAQVGHVHQNVVYGDDDRTDVYDYPEGALRDLAEQSVAAMVLRTPLEATDGVYAVPSFPDLQTAFGLCDGEAFAEQPVAADCSGTLITSDLYVTAGHCVENQAACDSMQVVFDYFYRAEGELEEIGTDDVYGCAEIVVQEWNNSDDYAVVRLGREVVGRTPATVSTSPDYSVGAALSMIGYGWGLPSKIDDGGNITQGVAGSVITTSLDAFGGNSGSGVFDEDGEMVGILIGGLADSVTDGSCERVNVLDESEGGEAVTRMDYVMQVLCQSSGAPEELCGDVPDAGAGSTSFTTSSTTDGGVAEPKGRGCSCQAGPGLPASGGGVAAAFAALAGLRLRRRR